MGAISGSELLFVLVIVGLLFLLGLRIERKGRRPNVLPILLVGLLLLVVFYLSRLVFAIFAYTLLLIIAVGILLVLLVFRAFGR
jgi:hypothetical protein